MYKFFAYIKRMKYINRWGLMRNTRQENLQEHSYDVAILAHALALIRKKYFDAQGPDPAKAAVYALYHDVTEIITGDLPTPVKYYSKALRAEYKNAESNAASRLLRTLPDELRDEYQALVAQKAYEEAADRNERELLKTVKMADTLSAYLKCLEETEAGNREFKTAAAGIYDKLKAFKAPELDWFLEHCLDAYSLDLDMLEDE